MKATLVRIKMTKNKLGAADGINVKHYEAGQEYDVSDDLAETFINVDRVAEAVDGVKAEAPLENKADKPAKNKAA